MFAVILKEIEKYSETNKTQFIGCLNEIWFTILDVIQIVTINLGRLHDALYNRGNQRKSNTD